MSAAHATAWASERPREALVDSRSPLHFGVGLAAGALGVDTYVALMVFVGAKIVEESFITSPKHALFSREGGQSLGNQLTDILFEIGGLYCGNMLRTKLTEQAPATAPVAPQGLGYALNEINWGNMHELTRYLETCRAGYYDPRTGMKIPCPA